MEHKSYLNKIMKKLFKMQNRLIVEYELVLKKKNIIRNAQRKHSKKLLQTLLMAVLNGGKHFYL